MLLKLFNNPVSMDHESGRLQVVVVIQQIDESLQLVAKQKRAKLLAISFLNIDQRMFTVEMGDDEVTVGEMPRGWRSFPDPSGKPASCLLAEQEIPQRLLT